MVTVNESEERTAPHGAETSRALDLVFLQDATGSQSPYIVSARDGIAKICEKIIQSQRIDADKLRFGLVAFRDYEPQDYSMLAKDYGFTNDIAVIRNHLSGLRAMGGGDGPEAQAAAMDKALRMPWREDAMKVVVLITDAPPHGIGENGDFFPQGSPDGQDPLNITRQMAQRGIVLHVVACEPTLSQHYRYASEFYQALVDMTGGRMLPLLSADRLPDYILGASIETAALENILNSHANDINTELNSSSKSAEEYAEKLYTQLSSRGVKVDSLQVGDSYTDSRETKKNITTWMDSLSLQEARGKIVPSATSRLQQSSASHPSSSPSGCFGSAMAPTSMRGRMAPGALFGGPPPSMPLAVPTKPKASLAPMARRIYMVPSLGALPSVAPAAPTESAAPSVTSIGIQQEQVLRIVRQAQARSSAPNTGV